MSYYDAVEAPKSPLEYIPLLFFETKDPAREAHISSCVDTLKGNPPDLKVRYRVYTSRLQRNRSTLFLWELGPAPGKQVRALDLELWLQDPRMQCGEWRRTPEGRFGRGSRKTVRCGRLARCGGGQLISVPKDSKRVGGHGVCG